MGALGEIAILEALGEPLDESMQIKKKETISRTPESVIAETFSTFELIKKHIKEIVGEIDVIARPRVKSSIAQNFEAKPDFSHYV